MRKEEQSDLKCRSRVGGPNQRSYEGLDERQLIFRTIGSHRFDERFSRLLTLSMIILSAIGNEDGFLRILNMLMI